MLSQPDQFGALTHQSKGFPIFFLTEMFERYGFYVIQTLLVFYLTDQLHIKDESSYIIVGSFTALAYINCFFGGIIADKFIGSSRSILLGGVLLSIGYALLAVKSNMYGLNIALAIISIGTGFLKPNVSELLSILYHGDEAKKENGYTIYYVGIYIGAISGSFVGPHLQHMLGWKMAFLSSALGSILAVITFWYGVYRFKLNDSRFTTVSVYNYIGAGCSIIGLIIVCYYVLHSDFLGMMYFILIGMICLFFLIYAIINSHGMQKKRLIAFLILVVISSFYWGIYFQQFFTISLCIVRTTNLGVLASAFPAVESLGIILFGPVINIVWKYFKDRGNDVAIPARFSVGFFFNSCGFLLIVIGLWWAVKNVEYLSTLVIVVAYLLIAIGELSLSPTSLSMVTTLVPAKFSSIMMGISLLSIGFGGKFAGVLANDAAISEQSSLSAFEMNYLHAFFNYFIISTIMFVVVLLLNKHLKKLIYSHQT